MSEGSFLDQVMTGARLLAEVDDVVDAWHGGDDPTDLRQVLGMTPEEYSLWLRDPDMLAVICTARRYRRPLVDAVNDNLPQLRMAARAADAAKLKAIEAWLRQQGKIA